MISKDYHSLWVNSAALAVAGGDLEVHGGVVERDAAGEPTGVLREEAAWRFKDRYMTVADEEYLEAMRAGIKLAHARGIPVLVDGAQGSVHLDVDVLERTGDAQRRAQREHAQAVRARTQHEVDPFPAQVERALDVDACILGVEHEQIRDGATTVDAEHRCRAIDAHERVAAQFPEDKEIAVLTADAMMVDSFNAAQKGGDFDHAEIARAAALLEQVLARDPDHTPAIHFYIHAEEALAAPQKAEPYADKLATLAPNASHLVHMPGHTWYWLGRYEDTAQTNARAVAIGIDNAKRLDLPGPDGVWGLPYHAHNVIYGLGGALMAGDGKIGLDLARPLVAVAALRTNDGPVMQLMAALGYEAIARFDPKSVAALPEPRLPYLKAAWHYARGEAAASAGEAAGVKAEMDAIPLKIAKPKKHDSQAPEQMLGLMRQVLAGRLAMLGHDPRAAAEAFRQAAEIEETRAFNDFTDPPVFWYPVRRDQAAALLAAGDAAGAKAAAEASLKLRIKDPVAEATLAKANAALLAVR